MEEGTVVPLPRPGTTLTDDPLLAVLLEGARSLLMQAIEAEVETFLVAHAGLTDDRRRRRLVRNGHPPERHLQTGIGPIAVRRPRVRDRGGDGSPPIRFSSAILPAHLRRTRNIEELLPWLYLKGVSTGQFEEALAALLGPEAAGLSAATVRRLTEARQEEHARWQGRSLAARRYVYLWADGVYFIPRLDHERQCLLVLIGADASGRKEPLAVEDGFRESAQSWRELLLCLRDENGLVLDPELATGDPPVPLCGPEGMYGVPFGERIIRLLADDGWPTSPTCRPRLGSSTWPWCWMPGAARSSAGRWPATCVRSW